MDSRYPRQGAWFKRLKKGEHNAEEARKAAEEKRRRDKEYRDEIARQIEDIKKREAEANIEERIKKEIELKRLKEEVEALEEKRRRETEAHEAVEKYKKTEADRIAREKEDFPQLATLPSSNFKRAGSGSRSTSQPHKARGITEVWNRNTISKDSTQNNELCALELRNRATISKDLTQSDGPFKSEMQNRGATSKGKIENDKARITGAVPPNASPGLYAVHQPSPVQQQQYLQQQFNTSNPSPQMIAIRQQQLVHEQQQRANMFAQQLLNIDATTAREMQLSPAQLYQLQQLRKRNAAARPNHEVAQQLALQQQAARQAAQQQYQQQAAMRRT